MILVTGATDGIGLETARQLARQGHAVLLHGRNADKAQHACAEVRRSVPQAAVQPCHADLSSLAEVAALAERLNHDLPQLDVLVNNAGVYMTRYQLSHDGYEMSLAVNHLAHFLLTLRLLPLLHKAASPRVVVVSSMVHSSGHLDFADMNCAHEFDGYRAYANSKLMNALFAAELARREPWLAANSLHPGVIDTKLLHAAFDLQGSPVGSGARTSVFLATAADVTGVSGRYFDNCREAPAAASVRDTRLAQQLWQWSEQAVSRWLQPDPS